MAGEMRDDKTSPTAENPPLRVLIDAPDWDGEWGHCVADALQALGHEIALQLRSPQHLRARIGRKFERLRAGEFDLNKQWERDRLKLSRALERTRFDLLLSLQGPLDGAWVQAVKKLQPGLQIWYWIGATISTDPFPIVRTPNYVDRFLASSHGIAADLQMLGARDVHQLDFAVSRSRHVFPKINRWERRYYRADVSLVGTAYPDRAEMVRELRDRFGVRVRTWGRGWRRYPDIKAGPPLSLAGALKVHACSKISLNPIHPQTRGGINMRFFEIPAAGGFQIASWQREVAGETTSEFSDLTVSFDQLEELGRLVHFYLHNDDERKAQAERLREHLLGAHTYERRLQPLLDDWYAHNWRQTDSHD